MKENKKFTIADLIISPGGMIIGLLSIGVLLFTTNALKDTSMKDYSGFIGIGITILFSLISFTSYYNTANKKVSKPRN